jgi:hypothetical protein
MAAFGHPLVTPGLHPIDHRSGKAHFDKYFQQYRMPLDRTGLDIFWEHVSGLRRLGDLNRWLDPELVTLQTPSPAML